MQHDVVASEQTSQAGGSTGFVLQVMRRETGRGDRACGRLVLRVRRLQRQHRVQPGEVGNPGRQQRVRTRSHRKRVHHWTQQLRDLVRWFTVEEVWTVSTQSLLTLTPFSSSILEPNLQNKKITISFPLTGTEGHF